MFKFVPAKNIYFLYYKGKRNTRLKKYFYSFDVCPKYRQYTQNYKLCKRLNGIKNSIL